MTRDSLLYPSYVTRDPLLWLQYMPSVLLANEGVAKKIDYNVIGDPFLNSYVCKLDEEIFSETPTFSDASCDTVWEDNRLDLLFKDATDEMRKHGWCVVQFYESDLNDMMDFKVFSGRHFVEWITEVSTESAVEDGKTNEIVRIGVKILHQDDLGNSYNEDLVFSDDDLCFLLTWKLDKTGRRYAEPDLNQSIMTLIYNIRQINGQLTFVGVKPGFKHFVYGDGKDTPFGTNLKNQMQYVDRSAGIGAKVSQLQEIREIPNGDIAKIELALDKQIKLLSGATRVPLSFYLGEKESGSLSGAGETVDMVRLDKKKHSIFKTVSPYIKDIMLYAFGKTTTVEYTVEEVEVEEVKPVEPIEEEEEEEDPIIITEDEDEA